MSGKPKSVKAAGGDSEDLVNEFVGPVSNKSVPGVRRYPPRASHVYGHHPQPPICSLLDWASSMTPHRSEVSSSLLKSSGKDSIPPPITISTSPRQALLPTTDSKKGRLTCIFRGLAFKLTVFRCLNIIVISTFATSKAYAAYRGESATPTTLDWVGGGLFAIL